jgi:hypothetical protein
MFSQTRLVPFSEAEFPNEAELEDAKAADRVCEALIALKDRANMSDERWARALGVDIETWRRILLGQIVDQPTGSLLLRAVLACGAKLKISLGRAGTIEI